MEGRWWYNLVNDSEFEAFKQFVTAENVNMPDRFGEYAIYRAIKKRQSKCFVHLLKMGADPNTPFLANEYEPFANDGNNEGKDTPLHRVADCPMGYDYDAKCDLWRYAWCLLKKGANVNARNSCDETPLEVAFKHGKYRTVATLLEFKADINAVSNGDNILHTVDTPREHHWECMRYVIDAGGALKRDDSPREWLDDEIRQIQEPLACCRLACRATERALYKSGAVCKDVCVIIGRMVWETRGDVKWRI